MNQGSCGIAVLYFNKPAITKRCIASILKAGYRLGYVFAFDNASSLECSEEIKQEFPDINHLRIEKNKGYSGGFNRALQWLFSRGFDSALFCTNDTIVYPGAAEESLAAAKASGAEIAAPCIIYLNRENEIDSIGGFFDIDGFTLRHYHQPGLPELLIPFQDYAPGTALWLSVKAFESLNGMDESFFTYWEDADFCFRAHQNNIKIARSYGTKIGHAVGKTCHKKPLYTAFYFQRNRVRFCGRYLEGTQRKTARLLIEAEIDALEKKWRIKNDANRIKYLPEIHKELDSL